MNRIPFDVYDFFGYLASGAVIVVGLELVFGFPHVLGRDLKLVDSLLLLLAVYVSGQLIATPAKALLEDGLIDKILGRPSINLFRERRPWTGGLLFPGFYMPLPEQIQKKILSKAERQGVSTRGEALFLHVRYSPDILKNDKLMAKLDSFRDKYGFARNLAFTSLLLGLTLLIKGRLVSNPELTRYAVTALIVGILLVYRYLKFFRQYSFEMFNTYAGSE